MNVRFFNLLGPVFREKDVATNTELRNRRSIHFALRMCRGPNEHLGSSVYVIAILRDSNEEVRSTLFCGCVLRARSPKCVRKTFKIPDPRFCAFCVRFLTLVEGFPKGRFSSGRAKTHTQKPTNNPDTEVFVGFVYAIPPSVSKNTWKRTAR